MYLRMQWVDTAPGQPNPKFHDAPGTLAISQSCFPLPMTFLGSDTSKVRAGRLVRTGGGGGFRCEFDLC